MKEFKESIPLFADLKNDALRDRWACMTMYIYICVYVLYIYMYNEVPIVHWDHKNVLITLHMSQLSDAQCSLYICMTGYVIISSMYVL